MTANMKNLEQSLTANMKNLEQSMTANMKSLEQSLTANMKSLEQSMAANMGNEYGQPQTEYDYSPWDDGCRWCRHSRWAVLD